MKWIRRRFLVLLVVIACVGVGKPGEYLTDRLTDEAVNFIAAHREAPFFLYLAHYAVHTPIQAKEELVAGYRERPGMGEQKDPVYAAMVQSVDESVGRIMDTLLTLSLRIGAGGIDRCSRESH